MQVRRIMTILAVLALAGAACSSDGDTASVTATASADGSTVTVTLSATGLDIVADPPSDEHYHVFLDVQPALDGTAIPTDDPSIVHSRDATVTFTDVASGEHTITVVVGGADHVPLDPAVTASTTVTV